MTDWEDFFDYVMPEVPGIGTDLALMYIRLAAIDFCDKSLVHTVMLDDITLVAGQTTYDIAVPDQTDLAMVVNAWVGTRTITPKQIDELNQNSIDWQSESGRPESFTQTTQTSISLYKTPDANNIADALRLRAALRPDIGADGLEDWVANKYVTTIAAGAMARLMSMPKKPWTDLQSAGLKNAMYMQGLNEARIDAKRGFSRGGLRVNLGAVA